jgi:sugar O-acyltransferase (sialic acid O-acetyltransferase NeuD family)
MNDKKIIIVGAGGLGREIFSWLNDAGKSDLILGFINDIPDSLNRYDYTVKIIGDIQNHMPIPEAIYVLAIMTPSVKAKVSTLLKDKGCEFMTFIHPTAILGNNVELGEGVVITPGCILTCDIEMGDFVFLNTQTTLGHDVKVGSYTSINGKVEISGFVEIGESVTIGSRVVVLPKKKIASGVMVGAGSVVVGNINQPITVFGNPAKRI